MTRTRVSTLEDLLGPSTGRYFAAGYRHVEHALEVSGWLPSAGEYGPTWSGSARVSYPAAWSVGTDGTPRRPHLSSVDAIALTVLAAERLVGADAPGRWVRAIELRASHEPCWELDDVPLALVAQETDLGLCVHGTVGTIRTAVIMTPPALEASATPSIGSVYGGSARRTTNRTVVDPIDHETCSVRSVRSFATDDPTDLGPVGGLESAYRPALTVIDHLVTMGQLVQALVQGLNSTDRDRMSNLWMRTMRISDVPRPAPLPVAIDTTTRVLRDTLVDRGGVRMHDLVVESLGSDGVHADARLAYQELP
ncbi:avirulence D protein (AvrD) [Sediminihabitans luteus]|uniref:Avirulence D protein (AvrD) n=1 Tax=Sediminihabitans luteus TaxID=1138585 RepID=A0A2M9CZJ8_9CELL|nr:avirulence D protein (AvrD) [Sediminihabitans luteus]